MNPNQQRPVSLQEICEVFELQASQIPNLNPTQEIGILQKNLVEFKELIKKRYRKLGKRYHPDVTVLDKVAANEKMVKLNNLFKIVNRLEVMQRVVPQPMSFHFSFRFSSGTTSYGGTSSGYTSYAYWDNY